MIGFMLIAFLIYLKPSTDSFTQIFLIILSINGLLSTFSISNVSEYIFKAVFITIFRLFVIIEIEIARKSHTGLNIFVMFILVILFGLYAVIDATALFERALNNDSNAILQSEKVRMWTHLCYGFGLLVFILLTWDSGNGRRFFLSVSLGIVSVSVTLFAEVGCVLKSWLQHSIIPNMLMLSIHSTFTSMLLFFLRSGEELVYKGIENVPDDSNIGLEIETESESESEVKEFKE
jgi:hypothetical protein